MAVPENHRSPCCHCVSGDLPVRQKPPGDDPNKQVPIANASIVASDGLTQVTTTSGVSGGFQLTVRRALIRQ
jgi:hypothetical protein